MAVAEHLVATTRARARLLEPQWAQWLWERMRRLIPEALSNLLMPDHLHMVAPPGARVRLRQLLAAFTVRYGVRFDVLPAQPAHSVEIARRMIRYGFVNPVRAGLVDDAWAWPWSTLRDLGAAAHPIWTPAAAVAQSLRVPAERIVDALTFAGRRPPQRVPVAAATFDGLRAAVAAALRMPESDVLTRTLGRRLIVQASAAIAPPHASRLAEQLGCCERTIRRDRAERHPALDAVLTCLADERLRRGPDAVR